jgi:hypothetical protein
MTVLDERTGFQFKPGMSAKPDRFVGPLTYMANQIRL